MECPRCRLTSPPGSARCDCGLPFENSNGPAAIPTGKAAFYFIDINSLTRQLRSHHGNSDGVSDSTVLAYVIGYILLFSISAIAGNLGAQERHFDLFGLIGSLITAGLAVLGVRNAYASNGGAQGVHFMNRLIPIAWVMGWRILLFILPAVVILAIVAVFASKSNAVQSESILSLVRAVAGLVIGPVVTYFYFERIVQHVAAVAQSPRQ